MNNCSSINKKNTSIKPPKQPLGWIAKVMVGIILAYRYFISPLLGSHCRYIPTCSEYAIEAIQVHGVLKGFGLGLWRILRCHPFAAGGVDDVPPKKK